MLYHLLKPFARDATRRFLGEIHLRGEPLEDGPLLIAANHVNVVLDGLLVILSYRRDPWFLVKGAIFRGPVVSKILSWLHLIPVYRKQDDPSQIEKNKSSFDTVVQHLKKNLAVLMFPEGESQSQRHLAPLHTGISRIALQGQLDMGEDQPVHVQPVGITYADFFAFNSSVTLCFGDPIDVRTYLNDYQTEPEETVRRLTVDISEQLKELTVDLSDARNLALIEMLSKLYQSKDHDPDDHLRLKTLHSLINALEQQHPERMNTFAERIQLHLELSRALKIDETQSLETRRGRIFMALVSPFVLLGVAVLFIPYKLSWWISKKLSAKSTQYSSWALSTAFFLFPLWYIALGCTAWYLSGSLAVGIIAIFFLIGTGYFTSSYFFRLMIYLYATLWPGQQTPVKVLMKMRNQLITELEQCSKDEQD